MTTQKGLLLVVDGMDGSGKTMQTGKLVTRLPLEGHRVATLSFPRYGKKSAGPVEDYLGKTLGVPGHGVYGPIHTIGPKPASVTYALDRWASFREGDFKPLEDGVHMVLNRFVASNMGHQGSKIADPIERMEYFRWNDHLEHEVFGIPRPDLNIILHVTPEVAMRLIDGRGIAKDGHENLEHLRAAEATYLEIARTFPNFVLIECMNETNDDILHEDVIHEKVWAAVAPLLVKVPNPA